MVNTLLYKTYIIVNNNYSFPELAALMTDWQKYNCVYKYFMEVTVHFIQKQSVDLEEVVVNKNT